MEITTSALVNWKANSHVHLFFFIVKDSAVLQVSEKSNIIIIIIVVVLCCVFLRERLSYIRAYRLVNDRSDRSYV